VKANNSEILDRLPPQNLDAERGTIGSMIVDPTVIDDVAAIVGTDDFYARSNQILYGHLLAMHNEGAGSDITLLVERLKASGDFDLVGGYAYLAEVNQSVPTASHAAHYAKIVREKSMLRGLINAGTEILRSAYEQGDQDAAAITRIAESKLARLLDGGSAHELVAASDAVNQALAAARESVKSGTRTGLPTGFVSYDVLNGGLHLGELSVFAARPGGGKTSMGLQIAAHSAMKGRGVLFVSLEMGSAELVLRILCGLATVDSAAIRTGRLTDRGLEDLERAARRFANASLMIDDRPVVTVAEIRRTARRLKRQGNLCLIVVDYLQRLSPSDPRAKRYEAVGQMSNDLKTLARELNVPVLCLAQLNREIERGGNGRPQLSHLRESGNIE
jgi:replicative DNA helicase